MPLKYLSGMPETGKSVVFWVGLIHGILFIIYAAVTFIAWGKGHLTGKLVGLAAIASIMPFGPFVIDRRLKAHEESSRHGHARASLVRWVGYRSIAGTSPWTTSTTATAPCICEDVPVPELAEKYGTPLYVYSAGHAAPSPEADADRVRGGRSRSSATASRPTATSASAG